MTGKKQPTKKKSVDRRFVNGTREWADHQTHLFLESRKTEEKEWEAALDEIKQKHRFSEAEKLLKGGIDLFEHFVTSNGFPVTGFYNPLVKHFVKQTTRCLALLATAAHSGDEDAINGAWRGANYLVEAVHAISKENPERLKPIARKSLFLPALRTGIDGFTDDFEAIASRIELSKSYPIRLKPKKRIKLDSPQTRYMIEFVADAIYLQKQLKQSASVYHGLAKMDGTLDEYLLNKCGFSADQLIYRELPPLGTNTAQAWIVKALRPSFDKPDTMKILRGSPLYAAASKSQKVLSFNSKMEMAVKPLVKAHEKSFASAPKPGMMMQAAADHSKSRREINTQVEILVKKQESCIKDEIKKRCEFALTSLAKNCIFPT